MKVVQEAEKSLENVFKDLPGLPRSYKDSFVKVMPWLALIFGVLQIAAAWVLYGLVRTAEHLNDVVNSYSFYTHQVSTISASDRTIIYVGTLVLFVEGVIGLLAYGELKKQSRRGWDLLFLASLINVAYAVLSIFINGRGFGSFVGSAIGSAIGFYLLFQVRDRYGKAVASHASDKPEKK